MWIKNTLPLKFRSFALFSLFLEGEVGFLLPLKWVPCTSVLQIQYYTFLIHRWWLCELALFRVELERFPCKNWMGEDLQAVLRLFLNLKETKDSLNIAFCIGGFCIFSKLV